MRNAGCFSAAFERGPHSLKKSLDLSGRSDPLRDAGKWWRRAPDSLPLPSKASTGLFTRSICPGTSEPTKIRQYINAVPE